MSWYCWILIIIVFSYVIFYITETLCLGRYTNPRKYCSTYDVIKVIKDRVSSFGKREAMVVVIQWDSKLTIHFFNGISKTSWGYDAQNGFSTDRIGNIYIDYPSVELNLTSDEVSRLVPVLKTEFKNYEMNVGHLWRLDSLASDYELMRYKTRYHLGIRISFIPSLFISPLSPDELGIDRSQDWQKDRPIFLLKSIRQGSIQKMEQTAVYHQKYLDLLQEVLLKTFQSNSNPEIVYVLLQKNLDKLDETFAEVLSQWATFTFPILKIEQAYELTRGIFEFSRLISQFPIGNQRSNLEIAIKGYEAVALFLTPDNFPQEWAAMQNNLGDVYRRRIKEDRAENLEKAITCLKKSLTVRTPKAFPYEWALTQHALGAAYGNRIKEDRAENLEKAITCLKKSLTVLTPEDFPSDWASTQNNLGNAYGNRIKGDRAENLEKAITYHQESLKVLTPEASPYDWAATHNNLGTVYSERTQGDRAENLEKAISCYRSASEVYEAKAYSHEWGMTQNNLGAAYCHRIRGKEVDNIEEAIIYYKKSLKVLTLEAFPYEWARAQTGLGAAYWNRIKGDRAENLENAITCYQESLKVLTLKAFPYDWAVTQNNLGGAYSDRIEGERAKNIEKAITYFQKSLKVYTPEAFPYNSALTQNNLGNAYWKRIEGERAKNIEKAITYFQKSLEGLTAEDLPIDYLRTGRNLGHLAFEEGNWKLAIEAYNKAIEALEISRSWAMTPQSKQEVMEAAIDVYYSIVQALLNNGENSLALKYVESSKTRNLVDILAARDLKPKGNFSPYILTKLERLRDEIRTEQIFLANQERKYNTLSRSSQLSQFSSSDRIHLKQLQQDLDELIKDEISPIDPTFSLTPKKVESITFSEIQSLIDEHTAIIQWYITGEKILAFILTSGEGGKITPWESSSEDLKALLKRTNGYLRLYYRKDNKLWWREQLESRLQNLAKILHLDEILSYVPRECERLILIPHRFLHIFPLHALSVCNSQFRNLPIKFWLLLVEIDCLAGLLFLRKLLLDLFPRGVQYVPSCQLLKTAQSRQLSNLGNLFAIQNPTEDLIYTDLEVETISSFFANSEVLAKQAASEASLKLNQNNQNLLSLANCVHFSCHGTFNPIAPLESALVLSRDEDSTEDGQLTLAEIFELSLPQCRLVTLSACETGFTDFNSLSDEYIGLPNGFLFAGSPSIVSSLWTVNDLSSAFLMVKFYENLPQSPQAGEVAISLNQAQKWLRNLTVEEFDRILEQFKSQLDQILEQLRPGQRIIYQKNIEQIRQRKPYPFAKPYYWAAFTAIGV